MKNIFEVERFSGRTVRSIEQDFFGVIFLTTLESVLSKPAEAELAHESASAQRKHVAQVNHAVSYLALVDHTVALLLDPPGIAEETLTTLHCIALVVASPGTGGGAFDAPGFIVTWSVWSLNLMALHRRPLAVWSERERAQCGRQTVSGGVDMTSAVK